MALRYVVQEADEFNALQFQKPTGITEFGELIQKYPLMKPYDEQNEIRCTNVIGHFPKKENFNFFKRYDNNSECSSINNQLTIQATFLFLTR